MPLSRVDLLVSVLKRTAGQSSYSHVGNSSGAALAGSFATDLLKRTPYAANATAEPSVTASIAPFIHIDIPVGGCESPPCFEGRSVENGRGLS
jgi:hypothetical protein